MHSHLQCTRRCYEYFGVTNNTINHDEYLIVHYWLGCRPQVLYRMEANEKDYETQDIQSEHTRTSTRYNEQDPKSPHLNVPTIGTQALYKVLGNSVSPSTG